MLSGTIVVFKLSSGEEMIGKSAGSSDTHVEFKNPAVIMLQRTDQGVGVALMPYMPYCEGNVKVNKSSIVAEAQPSVNMINEYNRLYGSGLQLAPASALSGLPPLQTP